MTVSLRHSVFGNSFYFSPSPLLSFFSSWSLVGIITRFTSFTYQIKDDILLSGRFQLTEISKSILALLSYNKFD